MGEVISAVFLVLLVVLGVGGLFAYLHSSARQRKSLINAPAIVLPEGESPDILLANATHYYTELQKAVRILDKLKDNPQIDRGLRRDMTAIVNEHYK